MLYPRYDNQDFAGLPRIPLAFTVRTLTEALSSSDRNEASLTSLISRRLSNHVESIAGSVNTKTTLAMIHGMQKNRKPANCSKLKNP